MVAFVNLSDTDVLTVVRSVLLGLLPPGIEVIRAYGNRVPEPLGPDFCVLSPPHIRTRLSTNRDTDLDLSVTGQIVDDTMVVSAGAPLVVGTPLYGPHVRRGSLVTAIAADGASYTVAPPQTAPPGSTIYVGQHTMLQPADLVLQCDVHGPNSSGNASTLAITWRDDAACTLIRDASGALEMQPLYADDPRMVPFTNAESQWEDRWIVDLHLQANIVVTLGQEFADELAVALLPVDLFLVPQPIPPGPTTGVSLEDGSGAWLFENGAAMEWG